MTLPIEVLVYIFLTIAVAWPVLLMHRKSFKRTVRVIEMDGQGRPRLAKRAVDDVMTMIPAAVYMIVWPILYMMIIAALVVYAVHVPLLGAAADAYYIAIISLIFINITMNHYWSVVAFRYRAYWAAFVLSILLLLSALVIDVLFGVKREWISMALFIPYVLWLCVATVLSAMAFAATGRKNMSKIREMTEQLTPIVNEALRGRKVTLNANLNTL